MEVCTRYDNSPGQTALVIDRCSLNNKRVTQLLTGLPAALRILNLRDMSL